jgi:hypothetical protein
MTTFALSTVTIPTPTAYDVDAPLKNVENLAYVLLQILTVAKGTDDITLTGSGNMASAIEEFGASVLALGGYDIP